MIPPSLSRGAAWTALGGLHFLFVRTPGWETGKGKKGFVQGNLREYKSRSALLKEKGLLDSEQIDSIMGVPRSSPKSRSDALKERKLQPQPRPQEGVRVSVKTSVFVA